MAQVTVTIGGRAYDIACGEGEEERIVGLAAHVDGKVRALAGPSGHAGHPRLLAMASLLLADELWELRESAAARPPAAENGDEAEKAAERRAASILALAERLERLAEKLEAS